MDYHSRATWEKANKLEQGIEEINTLKTHDTVMIYEDPITEQKLEARACLLSKVMDIPDGLEMWNVCFDGEDGVVCQRTIKAS